MTNLGGVLSNLGGVLSELFTNLVKYLQERTDFLRRHGGDLLSMDRSPLLGQSVI
ncbi:MAG: hypothetical protein AAGF12_05520 [Myxococcota bacterium]